MDNYIIRIYRRGEDDPGKVTGTVEEVGVDDRKVFTGPDELWDILTKNRLREKRKRGRWSEGVTNTPS
jgi:hypothetical protein